MPVFDNEASKVMYCSPGDDNAEESSTFDEGISGITYSSWIGGKIENPLPLFGKPVRIMRFPKEYGEVTESSSLIALNGLLLRLLRSGTSS